MGVERSFHTLLKMNQKDGFDCPSCAWPDPDGKRKTAEFCENGAKVIASEATIKRLTPEVFFQHPIPELAKHPDVWLETLGRITHPMVRRKDSDFYEPISWEDSFDLIGRELRALSSPNEASFYTSGRASNEAAFLYGLFARPSDRYRGISHGRRVVFLNTEDIARLGFEKSQWVDLISHYESETRRAERFKVVPYQIPVGCAAGYFPETNVLVPIRDVAAGSNQPASKSIPVTLEAPMDDGGG